MAGTGVNIYAWQYESRQRIAARVYQLRHPRAGCPSLEAIRRPERVLLVVAGLLGDTVMSLPAVAAARRAWPSARITMLGQRHNYELLADCRDVDEHIETSVFPFSVRRRGEVAALKATLAARRFGAALLILGDQFALMLADIGVPVRVGVRDHALAPCLTHQYEIGSPREWGPNERLNALRVLGFDVPASTPRLEVSASTVEKGRRALERAGLRASEPYAIVHPFGRTLRQWWPIDRVADVASELEQAHGWQTVIVGGESVRGSVPPAMRQRVVDGTGALSIPELVGALAGASLVLSTDSGPFHIAGALNRPLIGLFRDRRPEHASRYPQGQVLFGHDAACAAGCEWDRCDADRCRQMDAIAAATVLQALHGMQEQPVVAPS